MLFLYSNFALTQYSHELFILSANWAPDVDLIGYEELRFSPSWSDAEREGFWSLVMAWEVNASDELTIKEIGKNFEAYFDGLMKPNHWATTFPSPVVVFIPNPEKEENFSLIGKMKFFDGFHTGKIVTQNILVEQHFFKDLKKTVLIFRISPQSFEHVIWDSLKTMVRKPTSHN